MIKIIKYTVDEKKALEAIEEKYRPELTRAYAAVNELDSETQLSEYLTASERVSDIHAQIQAEREVYYKRAEMRALDEFSGDVERIVNAVKGQVLTFIYVSKVLAVLPPEATQELEEMDVSSFYDGMYSAKGLRDRINESFSIYFDFLQKTDTQAYAELQAYIDEAIERRDEIEPAEDNEAEADEIIERAPSKKKAAEYIGAITEMGERALSITDRNFQFALSTRKNKTAYLIRDKKLIESLEFNDGRLSLSSNGNSSVEVRRGDDLGEAEIDLQLLKSLFTAIYYNAESATEDTVTVYVPTLCKHLGVNITSGKAYSLFDKINAFNDCVGVFENGNLYALLKFIKYDKEQNLITFASPYMNKLISDIAKRNKKTLKSGSVKILPAYSYLIHSNIANERNKVAVEIVHVIVSLALQRGTDTKKNPNCIIDPTDGKVITPFHISFASILDYIPTLQQRIETSTTTGAKNAQLKRAFSKAYELLETKTDIYKNYIDLKIPHIIPTASTLNTSLNMTHKGVNPDYKAIK